MSLKYRPDIDGIRAIAVLMVVIYHAFPESLPGGFIGVDIFFVISGYLITSILKKEMDSNTYSIREFYRRRIDRIFPALLVVMFSCILFGWFTLFADEFMQVGKQIAGGAGFIANIVLFSETGYFNATSSTKPLLHLWSLGVEEQYYLFFPVILYILFKRNISILSSIVTLALLSFILNVFEVNRNVEAAFYLPQYRFWELLAGSIIALLPSDSKALRINRNASIAISVLSVLALIYTSLTINSNVLFPGWYALVPVISTSALILTLTNAKPLKIIFSSKPLVALGLISYPLYLWHWPLLSFAYIINGDSPSEIIRIYLVVTSVILAAVTYIGIEKPLKSIRSWKNKTIPMMVAMTFIGCFGLHVFDNDGVSDRANIKLTNAISSQLNGALWQYTSNDICLRRFNFPELKSMPWWFCSLKRDESPNVVIVGNSFANHLYPAFAFNKNLKDVNVLSIGMNNVVEGIINSGDKLKKAQFDYINGIITSDPKVEYVVISGVNSNADQNYIDALSERIKIFMDAGKKVIVFYPHVMLTSNIKACFARPLKQPEDDCVTDTKEVDAIRSGFSRVESYVSIHNPGVMFFDPNVTFCTKKGCSSIIDGMPVYRDQYKHLSEYASLRVGDEFAKWAKENAPDLAR